MMVFFIVKTRVEPSSLKKDVRIASFFYLIKGSFSVKYYVNALVKKG